jgi:hypothetical protein
MTPELFRQRIGPLAFVKRPGKRPLLFAKAKARKNKTKISLPPFRSGRLGEGPYVFVPVFVGVDSVAIRKRLNIARIVRLAHRPVCAFEFRVTGGDPAVLRSVLVDAAALHGVDIAVQPERTVFERVATAGLPVVSIGASAYGTSGLTRAVLRGGDYIGIDDPGDMVAVLSRHRRGLAYAYLPDLDRLGHVHGTDSAEWRTCLRDVDDMVARILDQIGDDHQLIVTADHGMVDCPSSGRVEMEDLPMSDDIVAIAGEPRLRYAYCRSGSATRVLDAWRDVLAEVAWVLSREEVVASGLMGEMEPDYAERLGDVVVIARGNTVLASSVDPIVSGLIGQHGAVTDAEMDIPLLQGGGHGHG